MSDNCTLYCGNINEKVTEELLYELFLQAGPIQKITIPAAKTFCFIIFKHEVSVQYAKALFANTRLFGHYLNLQPKKTNDHSSPVKRSNFYSQRQFSNDDTFDNALRGLSNGTETRFVNDRMMPVPQKRQKVDNLHIPSNETMPDMLSIVNRRLNNSLSPVMNSMNSYASTLPLKLPQSDMEDLRMMLLKKNNESCHFNERNSTHYQNNFSNVRNHSRNAPYQLNSRLSNSEYSRRDVNRYNNHNVDRYRDHNFSRSKESDYDRRRDDRLRNHNKPYGDESRHRSSRDSKRRHR